MTIHRYKKRRAQRVKISALAAAFVFVAAALVFGVAAQPAKAEKTAKTQYSIKKGDTLWSISGSKLNDHFQWPLIWKENAGIKNPDRIYPGQRINIPALVPSASEGPVTAVTPAPAALVPEKEKIEKKSALRKAAPGEEIITPIKKSYLFTKEEMISSGFMTKKVPSVGDVRGPVGERALIATGDDVYINLSAPPAVGDKFIVAGVLKIDNPLTGKFAGYLIEPHGIAVVNGENAGLVRATITRTYERVGHGDILIKYVKPEQPLWDTQRKPAVEGHVLALEKRRLLGSGMDIIYLDKGKAQGLEAGDLLQTKTGPDTNAIIQIVTVQPDFATATIKESKSAVSPGDHFTGLE